MAGLTIQNKGGHPVNICYNGREKQERVFEIQDYSKYSRRHLTTI
jgi:hypothetical protein